MSGAAARRRGPLLALVGAYFVSGTGTALSAVAIPWLVLVTTGSAVATGVVGFAEMAPYVLLQATAGPLVDRVGLRRTFLLGNLAASVAVFLVFLLGELGALPFGLLLALVAVAGAVRGAADAATTPMIPPLARLARWSDERAVGLYSGANRAGLLIGLPLAGALVAVLGPAGTVLLDSISFLAAAVLTAVFVPAVVVSRPPEARDEAGAEAGATHSHDAPRETRGSGLRAYLAQLREGAGFLRRDRLLLSLLVLIVVTNLLDQAMNAVFLPVWAHDRVHDAVAFGVVGGASGLGMLVGVLLTAWGGRRLPRWITFALCTLLASAPPFFAVAGTDAVLPVAVVFFVCGVFGGVPNPIVGAVQFERVPPRLQTRVLGGMKASAYLGIPFGSLFGGLLAQAVGLAAACVAAGAVMLVVTIAPLVFPVWRGLDRGAPGPATA
ncbi:MFS transporter [Leifsonia sp. TF02-11]|uniref:MFS transporter n=1 Tax=Leifsonia sp. TF02-11 TaxID=2815212 RepID=UPI001AA18478|nr:MFS transporter [Leifsonia sp. TF02-11]MBO1741872.1 MFS transporter [Leifsonia sp. TF02-11]